jgi:hypothetical protein
MRDERVGDGDEVPIETLAFICAPRRFSAWKAVRRGALPAVELALRRRAAASLNCVFRPLPPVADCSEAFVVSVEAPVSRRRSRLLFELGSQRIMFDAHFKKPRSGDFRIVEH